LDPPRGEADFFGAAARFPAVFFAPRFAGARFLAAPRLVVFFAAVVRFGAAFLAVFFAGFLATFPAFPAAGFFAVLVVFFAVFFAPADFLVAAICRPS
jgi:hypothetical protein